MFGSAKKRGGSVAIYVLEGLTHYVIEYCVIIKRKIECLEVFIKMRYPAVVYMPPLETSCTFIPSLNRYLSFTGLLAFILLLWVA